MQWLSNMSEEQEDYQCFFCEHGADRACGEKSTNGVACDMPAGHAGRHVSCHNNWHAAVIWNTGGKPVVSYRHRKGKGKNAERLYRLAKANQAAGTGADKQRVQNEAATDMLNELEVDGAAAEVFKELCRATQYNPILEVINALKNKAKGGTQGISPSKRLDANMKLMEYLVPKPKAQDVSKKEDTGITVNINDGEVK